MLFIVANILFWTSLAALFYTYVGYPVFVFVVSRAFPKTVNKSVFSPFVTVLITAYNEEKDIRAKLQNTLGIDYPKDRLEILVASDGSSDKTDEIVREFADFGVKLFRQEGRVGKTTTQNNAVARASGEIILFSDATTIYNGDILSKMLPNFADASIGCVAGKLIYADDGGETSVGKGARRYWNYETFIKENESRACSLIGASGCLYAVRKSAYRPMYAEACSDFLIATVLYQQGLRTVFEPDAACREVTNRSTDKELTMRIRVISQTFTDLWRNRSMMNPVKSGFFAVQLISHKLFRYAVPFFLVLIFLSSGFLAFSLVPFVWIFAFQVGFYALSIIGWVFDYHGYSPGVFSIPVYFALTNLASTIAFVRFLRGETFVRWEPIRERQVSDEQNPDAGKS